MADAKRDEYAGKPYVPLPQQYHGYAGQGRYAKDKYQADESEGVVGMCMQQAAERLRFGEDCAVVEDWLRAQVLAAMNDAAARHRYDRRLPAAGEWQKDPEATRAAIAKKLAAAWCRADRRR
jgi:hypothetical protein